MKWLIGVLLLFAGLFYLGTKLMPSPDTIEIEWVRDQIKMDMTMEEVRATTATDPQSNVRDNVGNQTTWYFSDRFDPNDQLVVHFVEGRVYRTEIERK